MPPDPKTGRRIVDPAAVRAFLLGHRECCACTAPAANAHHVVQKGSPHFGDDVAENLVPICGTGTMRCHGAMHGTPYTVYRQRAGEDERRDQAWVARRIGGHLRVHRPDVLAYVTERLGSATAAAEFFRRNYYIEVA